VTDGDDDDDDEVFFVNVKSIDDADKALQTILLLI